MNEAVKVYLQDVLGVEWVPRETPVDLRHEGIATERTSTAPQDVIVVVSEPLSTTARELISKMMASIQIEEYTILPPHDAEATEIEKGVILLGLSASSFNLNTQVPVVELPALAALMDDKDPIQLQQTKRQAWVLLQKFKKELNS